MADVKSKNLFELLGNTSDQDSDKEQSLPPKVADKPSGRSGKRDAPKAAPTEPGHSGGRGGRGGRRGGFTGSEDAFRDRNAGSVNNRGKPTDDALRQDRHSDRIGGGRIQGNYEGRGGRGGRGSRGGRGGRDDRHSRSGQTEHTKQVDQGWGAPTGDAEWSDEKAGDAIAASEVQEGGWDASTAAGASGWDEGAGQGAPGFADSGVAPPANDGFGSGAAGAEAAEPAEPEDTSMSYADYVEKQAEKKMQGLGIKEARKPNEGATQDKKWQNAKAIKRDDSEQYIPGAGEKAKRERDRLRNAPQRVDVDLSWKASAPDSRGGARGGRGERRGGDRGGRGDYRGRGDGEFRGRGRGRGDGEYRGRGSRGGGRGRGGSDSQPVAVNDESAFPSLGT